jgi:hypothetical protein
MADQLGGWGAARVATRLLSKRGWAGEYTDLERAWLHDHPPAWWSHNRHNALKSLYAGRERPPDVEKVLGVIP